MAALVVATGFTSVASAQSSGDGGGAPQNAKQCRSFLRSVDKALVWENNRYAKVFAKLDKRRAGLRKRSASLTTTQAGIKAQMDALEAALDQEDMSQEEGDRLVAEYNALIPTYEKNGRSLQTVTDTLDGLKFEFSEAKKLHKSNVKNTVKYRKQVATYCRTKV